MNHILELKYVKNKTNGLNTIKKISKENYVILDTGEYKDYNINENRKQNISGLKDSFRKIRDLINNNFTGQENELHITLTYADNMKDIKQLYKDFQLFYKRYKYKYGNNIEYLSVVEPQERGAWHCHVLIKHNDTTKIFIKNAEFGA